MWHGMWACHRLKKGMSRILLEGEDDFFASRNCFGEILPMFIWHEEKDSSIVCSEMVWISIKVRSDEWEIYGRSMPGLGCVWRTGGC
jgi:hypothetical protein